MPVLTSTIQRVTLDLARHLLLTMPVLTIQRVTLDLARDLLLTPVEQYNVLLLISSLLTMPVLTIQRVTLINMTRNTT